MGGKELDKKRKLTDRDREEEMGGKESGTDNIYIKKG